MSSELKKPLRWPRRPTRHWPKQDRLLLVFVLHGVTLILRARKDILEVLVAARARERGQRMARAKALEVASDRVSSAVSPVTGI